MKYAFDYGPVDAALREIYTSATRAQFTLRVRRLVVDSGVSRAMLHHRAMKLGLRFTAKRHWTRYEDEYLRDFAGQMSLRELAKVLGRSKNSISCRLGRLALSAKFRNGYSIEELSECLGAADTTVRQWLKRKWLFRRDGRIPPQAVNRFIAGHLDEICFRRADEQWLKRRIAEFFPEGKLG